ncbi:class D sortase [Sediminibacillus albus]|nr:class D sortase [Sediminibacillus albus]
MALLKTFGILLLGTGIIIIVWSGYAWWEQGKAVTHQPDRIQGAHPDWKITKQQKTMKTIKDDNTPNNYQPGESVGELEIPRIGNHYEIFWGTGAEVLKKGVGLHDSQWTVAPDRSGHVVLSGHRDTVFRKLDQVKSGDHLYVTFEGTTYDYQVKKIWITDKDDRSVIVSKEDPTLTLTTCYPFNFVGSAPKRYIIQAGLVSKGMSTTS